MSQVTCRWCWLRRISAALVVVVALAWLRSAYIPFVETGPDYEYGFSDGVAFYTWVVVDPETLRYVHESVSFDTSATYGLILPIWKVFPASPTVPEMGIIVVPSWLAIALSVITWVIAWHFHRHPRPGHCPQCDYDLTGNVSGVCPECGQTIDQNASPHSGQRSPSM